MFAIIAVAIVAYKIAVNMGAILTLEGPSTICVSPFVERGIKIKSITPVIFCHLFVSLLTVWILDLEARWPAIGLRKPGRPDSVKRPIIAGHIGHRRGAGNPGPEAVRTVCPHQRRRSALIRIEAVERTGHLEVARRRGRETKICSSRCLIQKWGRRRQRS